jgi:hypothetical protein
VLFVTLDINYNILILLNNYFDIFALDRLRIFHNPVCVKPARKQMPAGRLAVGPRHSWDGIT